MCDAGLTNVEYETVRHYHSYAVTMSSPNWTGDAQISVATAGVSGTQNHHRYYPQQAQQV